MWSKCGGIESCHTPTISRNSTMHAWEIPGVFSDRFLIIFSMAITIGIHVLLSGKRQSHHPASANVHQVRVRNCCSAPKLSPQGPSPFGNMSCAFMHCPRSLTPHFRSTACDPVPDASLRDKEVLSKNAVQQTQEEQEHILPWVSSFYLQPCPSS